MLKFRSRELNAEQFAQEYVRHHVLCQSKHKRDKYKCVVAYQALAKRFGLSAWQARTFEKRFRNYVYNKMQTFVEAGLRDVAELPHDLRWLRLVEDKFKLLPNLLRVRGERAGPEEPASPERVLRALCTQAVLRGAVQHPAMFETVQRALRLSTDLRELQDVWSSTCRLALQFVSLSSRAGDVASPPADLVRVADVALLYTDVTDFQLVDNESEQRYAEAEALSVLWQLVQRHGLEEGGAARWALAARDYGAGGRRASALLLRRRWHELTLRARRLLAAHWRAGCELPCRDPPTPLHIAIIKRYPHIVTSPMPSWSELVARGDVVYMPLNEEDFAEPAVEEPPPVTSRAPLSVTSQSALIPVTSQSTLIPVTSQVAPTPMTSQTRPALSPHFTLYEDTKLVKPDSDSEVALTVKCERVIKTEVLDNKDNEPYDSKNNAQNDTDNKYEIKLDIKKEPRETMSSRILFTDDDDADADDDADDDDDVISEPASDEDFQNCEFDTKLLVSPRVQLTRLQAAPCRILFEDDDAELDAAGNYGSDGQEVSGQLPNTNFRPTKKRCRLSKAQRSLCSSEEHNNVFYVKTAVHSPEEDKSKQSGPTAEGMPTLSQLKQVLATLTNVSSANHVLNQTRQYCCLARKHQDIADARRLMGIAVAPHMHPGGAACACCCGGARAPRLPALERAARDLRARLQRLLQDSSLRKNEDLPTASKPLQDKRDTSVTYNTTFIPRPLSVANSAATFRPVQRPVTRTPNKTKAGDSVPVCHKAVTPLHSEPAPVEVATTEHTQHDRGDGALTPPLPRARSDIPIQAKFIYDDTLVFPALVKTSIQLRVEIRDKSSPGYVLRPYNSIPLQVKLRCNKTIESDARAAGDIVAHVARLVNKTLVQVAITRYTEQRLDTLRQNQVLYIEIECNLKAIHSAFMHNDIYVEMACNKISFSGTLGQSGSASHDDHRCYTMFVHGPLLQNNDLVYKTERNEIEKMNIKRYHSKSTNIIIDSFCYETNRFDQFLTYPAYKGGRKSTAKNNERSQSKKKEILQLSPPVSTAHTAAAHDDDKQKPSEPNTTSDSGQLSDRDKLKLFSSKHACKYMRRTMDLLMRSKELPPVTLYESPIPTLFVGEYPKKTSQKIQPVESVDHKPVSNDLSRRDYRRTQKIKPKAYSVNNRQNSSNDYSEIIHKSIEIYDTDRTVDRAPGRRSLSVSFRNNIVTHNELMLVQKLKEKFKEQPHKLQNKQPKTCASSNKSNPSPVETKDAPNVQLQQTYPSTSNNSGGQNPEREISTKTEASLPALCVSPKEKSDAASNEDSKSSKDSDMPIIMDTATQPVSPKNSKAAGTDTSKYSAPVEQQSISPDVTPGGHSGQAPEPNPVPSVSPNDENSDSFKPAKLVQRRISDGIRKGFMFMVPSSLRGKNDIINVPESASHTKLEAEYMAQLDSCIDKDFEVLDPVRLIPLTLIPDELSAPKIPTAKSTISGKQLQEVPVISETDLLNPAAKARRASDASKNMNPPVLSKRQRRHSHHNFEPATKESSLKGKIKAEWFKNFVPIRAPRRRRQSVPNCSYPARSKLLSPINSAANVSDKPGYISANQSCKITQRKQYKVQIKWSGAKDPRPASRLVRRNTITTTKPVLIKTNDQVDLATSLTNQLAKVSPKLVSSKAEPTAKYLEKLTSPTVMPRSLKIIKRPICLVRIRPWAGRSDNNIDVETSDITLTNADTLDEALTPPTLADTAPNSNSDMDSADTKNPNCLKRRNSLCQNEDHQDKKIKLDIPFPPSSAPPKTNLDDDIKQEINACSLLKMDQIEIINIPDPPRPPLPSPPPLLPIVTSEPRHLLCITIPQQDDLQLEVSENEQLCLTLAEFTDQHLMLKSIPKPTELNASFQILEPKSSYLDISPTSNECQNISLLNTEQTGSLSSNISPDHNQKICGEPEVVMGKLKHMTDFVSIAKNKCNNADLTAASLAQVKDVNVANDENLKEQDQSTSSKVNSQVKVESKMSSPTEVELAKRDEPLMFSESVLGEYGDSITEELPTTSAEIKTELKQSMLAIIMPSDTTGLVELTDLNDDLAWHKDIKMAIENQPDVSFKGIGDLCKPTGPISTTAWDSKICEIAVQDIPLPSDPGKGAEVATGRNDPESTAGTKHVSLNENVSSLIQDIMNTEDPTASQQELPSIFIFKEEAPTVAASSLSSETMLLCFDRCQIPLSMCYKYLVLTDAKIPCYWPTYYTLAPYDDVVQVAMGVINPANIVNDNSIVKEQNSYDITVNENNSSISLRNVRNPNVAKRDNNESESGDNNAIRDNKDIMIGNNILSTGSNNNDDVNDNNSESGFNNDRKGNVNKAMVDEANHKMDNSDIEPNISPSTQGRTNNRMLSVVCTLASFRALLRSDARLWVLDVAPGRADLLERARALDSLVLFGDLAGDFLETLTRQLNEAAAQMPCADLQRN